MTLLRLDGFYQENYSIYTLVLEVHCAIHLALSAGQLHFAAASQNVLRYILFRLIRGVAVENGCADDGKALFAVTEKCACTLRHPHEAYLLSTLSVLDSP